MARRRRFDCSRGQSLVEFALLAPVLFVLLVGAAQIGAILYAGVTVASAAHDGARVASEQPINSGAYKLSGSNVVVGSGVNPCTTGSSNPVCQSVVQSEGLLSSVKTVVAPGTTQTSSTESCPPKSVTDGYVTVTVSEDVPIFIPFLNNLLANTSGGSVRTISTTVTMRVEPCDMTQGS